MRNFMCDLPFSVIDYIGAPVGKKAVAGFHTLLRTYQTAVERAKSVAVLFRQHETHTTIRLIDNLTCRIFSVWKMTAVMLKCHP